MIKNYAQKSEAFATLDAMDARRVEFYNAAMMKSFLLLLSVLAISAPLSAQTASWFTSMEPEYFTESGTLFNDSQRGVASNTLPMGSVVELSNPVTGRSTITTVIDTLPELPEGREAAVTTATADLLGMLDTGLADLKMSVIREGTIRKESVENTGWYFFDFGIYDNTNTVALIYSRLMENGLRPFIEIEDEGVHLYVRHVMAYQLSWAEERIALSGIEPVEPQSEPNPYS